MALKINKITKDVDSAGSSRDRADNFTIQDGQKFAIFLCPPSPEMDAFERTEGIPWIGFNQWSEKTGGKNNTANPPIKTPRFALENDMEGNRGLVEHPEIQRFLAAREAIPKDDDGNPDMDAIFERDPIEQFKNGDRKFAKVADPTGYASRLIKKRATLMAVVPWFGFDARGKVFDLPNDQRVPRAYWAPVSVLRDMRKCIEELGDQDPTDPRAAVLFTIERTKTKNRVEYEVRTFIPTMKEPLALDKATRKLIKEGQGEEGDINLLRMVAYQVPVIAELDSELLGSGGQKVQTRGGRSDGRPACFGLEADETDPSCLKCPHRMACGEEMGVEFPQDEPESKKPRPPRRPLVDDDEDDEPAAPPSRQTSRPTGARPPPERPAQTRQTRPPPPADDDDDDGQADQGALDEFESALDEPAPPARGQKPPASPQRSQPPAQKPQTRQTRPAPQDDEDEFERELAQDSRR